MSAAAANNDPRQIEMSIDLGGEQVLIERARYIERLGHPFTLEVDIIASLGEIDLLPHLGKPVAVSVYEDDELMRHFHGLITAGEFKNESGVGLHYRLVARPFTYYLDQNRNMAIFQDKSVPDIIKAVLDAAGVSDYKLNLTRTYSPRVYCVQYKESDWTFLTRLIEEEGIYYFWVHAEDKHEIHFCDAPSAHQTGKPGSLEFNSAARSLYSGGSQQRGGSVHYLESWGERVSSGGEALVTSRAFDFEKPERPLQGAANEQGKHPNDNREVYTYPHRFVDEGVGKSLSQVQLTALRRERQLYTGRTQATSLAVGTKLAVTEHPADRLNKTYLITATDQVLHAEQYRAAQSFADEAEEGTYTEFEAIPEGTPFNLPQVTPRPTVQGLETAIVSGPDGEEIYTDKYGRVKVRFHWDRSDNPGEKTTCFIRVAQFGGLGNIILPRIGQEVMVDFLHGDPDDPIVVGWVFNKGLMPVYPLPDNKTRSVWRTKSYMGGKSTKYASTELDTKSPGANELRFEDKSGSEEVFIHAEKDFNLRTRNNQTNHVANDQEEKVFHDRTAFVGNDEVTTIHNNQKLTVEQGNQTEEISMGNREVTIKQGSDKLDVKMGNISIKADLGKIEIEAMQSITLTVGQSSIKIDQMGVTIKGMMLKSEAQIQLETKGGVMTSQKAGAMHEIKGGIVMIN